MPFVHFFDGFRTSHEIQAVELIDDATLQGLMPAGATIIILKLKSVWLKPSSVRVGTSGNIQLRLVPFVASGRKVFASICGLAKWGGSHALSTRPPSMSLIIGTIPLYGM